MTEKTELQTLKERADKIGIPYAKNITVEKLKEKLEDALSTPEPEVTVAPTIRQKKRKEARKLVRVIVTPMDPQKRTLKGDIFSTGNAVIGRVKRFIPFNNENGWHIEQILLNMLKQKKFQVFTEEKLPNGKKAKRGVLKPAYAITELPPLTEEELADLAKAQQVRENL